MPSSGWEETAIFSGLIPDQTIFPSKRVGHALQASANLRTKKDPVLAVIEFSRYSGDGVCCETDRLPPPIFVWPVRENAAGDSCKLCSC